MDFMSMVPADVHVCRGKEAEKGQSSAFSRVMKAIFLDKDAPLV
jgi:hypothetical protein